MTLFTLSEQLFHVFKHAGWCRSDQDLEQQPNCWYIFLKSQKWHEKHFTLLILLEIKHVTVFADHPPDVLISDYEGLAQWLCGVEPDSRVLLHSSRQLASNGSGTSVEGACDGRQESLVCAAWTNTWCTSRDKNTKTVTMIITMSLHDINCSLCLNKLLALFHYTGLALFGLNRLDLVPGTTFSITS